MARNILFITTDQARLRPRCPVRRWDDRSLAGLRADLIADLRDGLAPLPVRKLDVYAPA